MEEHIKQWMLDKIIECAKKRDYSKLPLDFEYQAVKKCFESIKPHFDKKKDIGIRIRASKSDTFEELYNTIFGRLMEKI